MVNVLVIGAGQVGKAACRILTEAGHNVHVVVRDSKKGEPFLKIEVTPVVGDASRPVSFADAIAYASVIVDAVFIPGQDPFAANKAILAAVGAESKKSGKKRYIHISGGWVYGDHPGEVVDESYPLKNPMLATRAAFEKMVTGDPQVHGVILRPSAVYGEDWGRWRWLWQPVEKLVIAGHKDRIFMWNHVVDVADAILRTVEAPNSLVSGEVFDIAEDTRIGWYDLRRAIFKTAGIHAKEEEGPLDEKNFVDMASNIRCVQSAAKIRRVLGWKPRHNILDSLPLSFKVIKAHSDAEPAAKH